MLTKEKIVDQLSHKYRCKNPKDNIGKSKLNLIINEFNYKN